MRRLHTNNIVGQRYPHQGQQLRELVRNDKVPPKLLVLREREGAERPDVRSYTAALREQMRRAHRAAGYLAQSEIAVGRLIEVRTAPAVDLKYLAQDANSDPLVDSVLVMSPVRRPFSYEGIVGKLSPSKDVDGMNPASNRMPCTPKAIIEALTRYKLWKPTLKYTLVGRGHVNSYVDEALLELMGKKRYNAQVGVVTRSNEADLVPALEVSQVAIVAAGVVNQITPDMIGPRTKAIVGLCINDIAPSVRRIGGDLLVTPPHLDRRYLGIGALTASNAVQRTFDTAMVRSGLIPAMQ